MNVGTIKARWKRLLFLASLNAGEVAAGFHASLVVHGIMDDAAIAIFHVPGDIYKMLVREKGESVHGIREVPGVKWAEDVFIVEGMPSLMETVDEMQVMSLTYLHALIKRLGSYEDKALLGKFPVGMSYDCSDNSVKEIGDITNGLVLDDDEKQYVSDLVVHDWRYESSAQESRLRELAYKLGGNYQELFTRMLRVKRHAS